MKRLSYVFDAAVMVLSFPVLMSVTAPGMAMVVVAAVATMLRFLFKSERNFFLSMPEVKVAEWKLSKVMWVAFITSTVGAAIFAVFFEALWFGLHSLSFAEDLITKEGYWLFSISVWAFLVIKGGEIRAREKE